MSRTRPLLTELPVSDSLCHHPETVSANTATEQGTNPTETDSRDGFVLIDQLIRQQQDLTAVERFAHEHSNGRLATQDRLYRHLMPASLPATGEQYGFEVDLDRCSGCKACVTACHSMNGLDVGESWRDVGLLTGGVPSSPVMQHVTAACHHCLEPGCMSACPVDAYEKDPITGIVRHLDDQCFGCQYCTLACPYEVPKYNAARGIVRKCDMCSERLADGEAPACVQACPHEAIAIRTVNVQQARENAETSVFLPAAPDPLMTLPTTEYITARVYPRNTLPVDYYAVSPQKPHWPLVIMLVLTQLSVGAFISGMLIEWWLGASLTTAFRQLHATSALAFGLLALAASTVHLGRPQYAFRAVIGLRHSWLSREIVAFGAFSGSACCFASFCWHDPNGWITGVLELCVAVTGIAGVFSSAMIYVVTGREFWSPGRTGAKFLLTSSVLGISCTWLSILAYGLFFSSPEAEGLSQSVGPLLLKALIFSASCKLLLEASLFQSLLSRRNSPLKRSAALLTGPLSSSLFARFACGLLGGVAMPMFLLSELRVRDSGSLFVLITVSILMTACLTGELLERHQFFAASSAPRMPGGLRT